MHNFLTTNLTFVYLVKYFLQQAKIFSVVNTEEWELFQLCSPYCPNCGNKEERKIALSTQMSWENQPGTSVVFAIVTMKSVVK